MALTMKAARVNAVFRQAEAAKALSVNASTLSSWENGKTCPDLRQLAEMCELYGIEPNDIFLPKKSN